MEKSSVLEIQDQTGIIGPKHGSSWLPSYIACAGLSNRPYNMHVCIGQVYVMQCRVWVWPRCPAGQIIGEKLAFIIFHSVSTFYLSTDCV